MVPYEKPIISKQDYCDVISYLGNGKALQKNPLYFGFSCKLVFEIWASSYLKNQLGELPFFIAEKWSEGQDETFGKV